MGSARSDCERNRASGAEARAAKPIDQRLKSVRKPVQHEGEKARGDPERHRHRDKRRLARAEQPPDERNPSWNSDGLLNSRESAARHLHSTVTLFARLRGWSTSVPLSTAT